MTKKKCPPGRLRYLLHNGQYKVFISAWVHDAVGRKGGISGFSGFQVTGMIEGFFWVLNFLFQDFVWVGKFWQVFFRGA